MSLSFCPTLEKLYRTRHAVGRSGRDFPLTSGLSTINNLQTIRRMMLDVKPEQTLEVGMACGGSTLTFAATHSDLGHLPAKQHVAIDGFQREGFDDVGRLQLEEARLGEYVEVREELSSLALPKLVGENRKFQLVYIDGSHRFEDVFCDFYFVRQLTSIGGYILFDDSADREVAKVISFIRRNLVGLFEPVAVERFRDFSSVERLKYSAAQMLGKTQLRIFRKIKDGDRPAAQPFRSF